MGLHRGKVIIIFYFKKDESLVAINAIRETKDFAQALNWNKAETLLVFCVIFEIYIPAGVSYVPGSQIWSPCMSSCGMPFAWCCISILLQYS